MEIIILIWIFNFTTLEKNVYQFKGTVAECKKKALAITMGEDKAAGCIWISKQDLGHRGTPL